MSNPKELTLTGVVHKILKQESGTGSKGSWIKQSFVIKTTDQYPKEVAFEVWGDKAELAAKLIPGTEITVSFNPESREYNDKYYTTLRAWKWKIAGSTQDNNDDDFPSDWN